MSDGSEHEQSAAASDGSETNNPAASAENAAEPTDESQRPHEPHIQVLKGQPTDEELAALIAVLGSAAGGCARTGSKPSAPAGASRSTGCVTRCRATSESPCSNGYTCSNDPGGPGVRLPRSA